MKYFKSMTLKPGAQYFLYSNCNDGIISTDWRLCRDSEETCVLREFENIL